MLIHNHKSSTIICIYIDKIFLITSTSRNVSLQFSVTETEGGKKLSWCAKRIWVSEQDVSIILKRVIFRFHKII
jgi:hypothetical protein